MFGFFFSIYEEVAVKVRYIIPEKNKQQLKYRYSPCCSCLSWKQFVSWWLHLSSLWFISTSSFSCMTLEASPWEWDGKQLSYTATLVPLSRHYQRASAVVLLTPAYLLKWSHFTATFAYLFPAIPSLIFPSNSRVCSLLLPSFTLYSVSLPRRTKPSWPRWPHLSQLAASKRGSAATAAPHQNDTAASAGALRGFPASSRCFVQAAVLL